MQDLNKTHGNVVASGNTYQVSWFIPQQRQTVLFIILSVSYG